MNTATGEFEGRYEYGPFGELVREEESNQATQGYAATGAMRDAVNPFRFSAKYKDEGGLLYYGFRYYSPDRGRWLSRDPMGEAGGLNLAGFLNNAPIFRVDLLGLLDAKEAYKHYISGPDDPKDPNRRTPKRMSFSEINTTKYKPSDRKQVKTELGNATPRRVEIKDARMSITTTGDQGLLLGNVTLKLEGEFSVCEAGKWTFEGILKCYDDLYDFNKSTHRRWLGELLTAFGRGTPGKPYLIQIRGSKKVSESGQIKK